MAKIKKGDPVELPYEYNGEDVVKIVVETVNTVTGVVEEVKIIKSNGQTEIKNVTNIIVILAGFFARLAFFFGKLFGEKK